MKVIPFASGTFELSGISTKAFIKQLRHKYRESDLLEETLTLKNWSDEEYGLTVMKNSFRMWKVNNSLPARYVFASLFVTIKSNQNNLVGVFNIRYHLFANLVLILIVIGFLYFGISFLGTYNFQELIISLGLLGFYCIYMVRFNKEYNNLLQEIRKIKNAR